jgi:Fe2+ transport system protein B
MSLKQKYERILARERSLANTLARSVIRPKPFGVWDIMIPMVFILNFMKNKQAKELFIQNFMFTKKLALQATYDMLKNGRSLEEVMAQIKEKTDTVLETETEGIYSDSIRQEQMKEIDLLIDHYSRLLKTDGKDYIPLVVNAYQNRQNYTAFLKQLETAEKNVSKAAQLTLGDQTDTAALARLEDALARARLAEVDHIFGS